jgi:predicted CoA-binding protein
VDDQHLSIEAILGGMTRIAVVGISADPARPSNEVAEYLIHQGFKVFVVNPRLQTVFGMPCYPDLKSLPEPVEVVDVFRRSQEAGAVVDEAIAVGARAVWLQEGVVDEAAAARARQAGLVVVMDRCMLKEHSRRAAVGSGFAP